MIFNKFDSNRDIVAGRTTRVASGFWPDGSPSWDQGNFIDDFWRITGPDTPSPSYGTSHYDVRYTMYYLNVFPDESSYVNYDPYFSIAYGNFYGNLGSGSFETEISDIAASPTKAIYTQYKNILLANSDVTAISNGMFSMLSASTTTAAPDIWIINFSAYKMKDRVDEGLLQLNFSGSKGVVTLIDDSIYTTQNQYVYQLVTGSISNPPNSPTYEGLGLFYPQVGIVILNASLLANRVGISSGSGAGPGTGGPCENESWPYISGTLPGEIDYTYNHKTLFASMNAANGMLMNVRKSEYVPARHYFIRVTNRDFNYSNNPTYVYDGTDKTHPKGQIYNADFISDPRTYITTVGLYNDNHELVAVAKLSRPAVKSFDQELLIKVRLDF
ncbi:MAG TPA: hypothetical protein PLC59_01030 [Bacteroidales bacterium]|jgi:hypothetical protein|nr:hypothetical protein [Bacteroidales bacterium]HQI44649.1 hypothetical protein [Bacteroidales bacterium]